MKTIHLIAAAAIAAATTSTMAQTYVQVDLGQGHASSICDGLISCSDNAFAWGVTGGYVIGSGFSAELGYTSYGTSKSNLGGGYTMDLKAQALKLGAAYTLPFTDTWSADARLGLASVKATASETGFPSVNDSKTKPYMGLGVGVDVQKDLKLHAGVEWTKAEFYGMKANVRALTVGARYAF